jgi:hypothetical protein
VSSQVTIGNIFFDETFNFGVRYVIKHFVTPSASSLYMLLYNALPAIIKCLIALEMDMFSDPNDII